MFLCAGLVSTDLPSLPTSTREGGRLHFSLVGADPCFVGPAGGRKTFSSVRGGRRLDNEGDCARDSPTTKIRRSNTMPHRRANVGPALRPPILPSPVKRVRLTGKIIVLPILRFAASDSMNGPRITACYHSTILQPMRADSRPKYAAFPGAKATCALFRAGFGTHWRTSGHRRSLLNPLERGHQTYRSAAHR